MVVSVLTRVVAVLTTVVAVLTCRRFCCRRSGHVAVMTGTRTDCMYVGLCNIILEVKFGITYRPTFIFYEPK